ncbi:hypothetical protein ACFWBB_14620 [Streptomyces sp. NPDC060000]|uniref:hypothetical protein n=1 Tax=Streptomyces sp. NPDC060000 TaxID=3347031 RepID=UPI0036AE8844
MVGLLAPNSSRFAVAFHGILRSGATAATINALFSAHDIASSTATVLPPPDTRTPTTCSARALRHRRSTSIPPPTWRCCPKAPEPPATPRASCPPTATWWPTRRGSGRCSR